MIRLWLARLFLALPLYLLFLALPLQAQERLRLATYNTGLDHKGPGLLLKDILDQDADIIALAQIIAAADPDILLLTGFDTDFQNIALGRFTALIKAKTGVDYPYSFAPTGNGGLASGLDINRNNRLGDWADNWGFGRFPGAGGMALISRYPIGTTRVFDQLKWQDFGPMPQNPDGTPFYPADIWPQLRLAAHSLWDIEIVLPDTRLHLLAAHPTPPVFDGKEDANGLRNQAEISFLTRYLDGEPFRDDSNTTAALAGFPVVVLADLNADLERGESRKQALARLLAHPRVQNIPPEPTVWWEGSMPMRVDYVLPDTRLQVLGAGVFKPDNAALLTAAQTRHRLVWVDVSVP